VNIHSRPDLSRKLPHTGTKPRGCDRWSGSPPPPAGVVAVSVPS